uniref:Uncharacterized protein n=2 Tax=Ixodes ricinus TaxID=34613 RepID=V5H0L3_IXORI
MNVGVRLSVATIERNFALLAASVPTSVGDIPAARSNVLLFLLVFLEGKKETSQKALLRHVVVGRLTVAPRPRVGRVLDDPPRKDYLVDPASSHMLVSKIKPCMSKYMPKQGETANGSLNQLWFLRSFLPTWITVAILEPNTCSEPEAPSGATGAFIRPRSIGLRSVLCGDSG